VSPRCGDLTHRGLMDNPYFYSGSMVAQIAVDGGTLLWAILVVSKEAALASGGSSIAWLFSEFEEDWLAYFFLLLAFTQLLWLALKLPPLWMTKRFHWGSVGYAVLSLWWSFVALNALFGPRPLQPTAAALTFTVSMLALYAFVANPKPACRDRYHAHAEPA
jgi:hypothetical protein